MGVNRNINSIELVRASLVGFNGTYLAKEILSTDEFIKTWLSRRSRFNDESVKIFLDNQEQLVLLVDEMVQRRLKKRTINGRLYKIGEWIDYNDYLKSDHWRIRKQKLYKDPQNQACQRCGSTKNLQVHHKRYRNKYGKVILFEEHQSALTVLCRECHEKEHNLQQKLF